MRSGGRTRARGPGLACPKPAEQESYVIEWLEPRDAAAIEVDLDAARALRARYLGTVLGLACGDAMGATLQFRKPGQFTKVADLVGGGPWQLPRGAWTDETAMSLCLAESLLAIDGFDAADQRRRYRRWQLAGELSSTGACLGITAGVAALLQGGEGGSEPALIPNAVSDAQAITRIGVVALFAVSAPGRVLDWAAAAAAVTDRAPALRVAARYFAALLLAALRGTPRERLPSEAREILRAHGEGSESLDFERWMLTGSPAIRGRAARRGAAGGCCTRARDPARDARVS